MFDITIEEHCCDVRKYHTNVISQTLQCICVGNNPTSDGLIFYCLDFKSLIGLANYDLNPVPPAYPICGLLDDDGVQFNLHYSGNHI